jgi:hypothetical protein
MLFAITGQCVVDTAGDTADTDGPPTAKYGALPVRVQIHPFRKGERHQRQGAIAEPVGTTYL